MLVVVNTIRQEIPICGFFFFLNETKEKEKKENVGDRPLPASVHLCSTKLSTNGSSGRQDKII